MMLEDVQVEQYFTMVYAELDLVSGQLCLVQAGHPHPIVLRRSGTIEPLGQGGLPIGLIPGATYQSVSTVLLPGDRLVLVSDGVTECPGPSGDLGEEGLAALLRKSAPLQGNALLESLIWDLSVHADGGDFPDDVSCLLFDYIGPV